MNKHEKALREMEQVGDIHDLKITRSSAYPPLTRETIIQLRNCGWTEEKIRQTAERKANRDRKGD